METATMDNEAVKMVMEKIYRIAGHISKTENVPKKVTGILATRKEADDGSGR